MISHKNVRLALRNILLGVAGLPAQQAWENRDFTTPEDSDWIRDTYLAGDDILRANNRLVSNGIYAVDIFTPRGNGTEEIEDLADDIKSAFKAGTQVADPDIQIIRSNRGTGEPDGNWYKMPVRIAFRTFANNQ